MLTIKNGILHFGGRTAILWLRRAAQASTAIFPKTVRKSATTAREENKNCVIGKEVVFMPRVMSAEEAVRAYIHDGATVACGGFVGAMVPEEIHKTIQELYLSTGSPKGLTAVYAAGQGDSGERGLNHLGEEGLLDRVIGGHWGLVPRLQKLALENKCAAYNYPQGVISQLFRDIAAGKPGLITHVGLKTFADPELEGGMLNDRAREAGPLV